MTLGSQVRTTLSVSCLLVWAVFRSVAAEPGDPGQRPLRVGINQSIPYNYIGSDGKPTGFATEVIREAARRRGVRLEMVAAPEGPDIALASGKVDAFPVVTVIPERQGHIWFTDPWMQTKYVLLTRRDSSIRTASGALGWRISHSDSTLNARLAVRVFPGSRFETETQGQELNALCRGDVDAAFIETKDMLSRLLQRPGVCQAVNFDVIPLPEVSYQMAIGAGKAGIAQARVLRSAINDMAVDQTLGRIYSEWLHDTGDETAVVNELLEVRHRDILLRWGMGFLALAVALLTGVIYRKKVAERALRAARDFVSAVLDSAGGIVLITDRNGAIVRFNRACERATGKRIEEVEGRTTWELFVPPDEVPSVQALYGQLVAGRKRASDEHHWLTPAGRRLLSWSYSVLTDKSGRVEYLIGTAADISHREATEQRLILEATRDPLTNLLNRRGLSKELDRAIACARAGTPLRLGLADMDWFKGINDTFGHSAGDEVLCFFAGLLRESVGEEGIAARLGGDEFCFLLYGTDSEFSLARIRQRLHDKEFVSAEGQTFRVGASFGIAAWSDGMRGVSDLMEAADQALYEAKSSRKMRRTSGSLAVA